MANANLTETLHLNTVDELNRLLSEASSIFALMGASDPSTIPNNSMSYAACAGQRLLDQVMARIDATLR